jgi:tetratricopeptide (TPR) repeat protein
MKTITVIIILFFTLSLSADEATLRKGNDLLAKGDVRGAERVFREALLREPENSVYRAQLGLCLVQLNRYDEAERELDKVLEGTPTDAGALWYKALNSFTAGRHREAISRVKIVLPWLDPKSPQVGTAHWLAATSSKALLYFRPPPRGTPTHGSPIAELGLTYAEVDDMVSSYRRYLELQPAAPDKDEIREFLVWVSRNRPPESVKRWLVANQPAK